MFGGSLMRKITIGCSRSNPFACMRQILLKRLTRYGIPSPQLGQGLTGDSYPRNTARKL